MTHRDRTQMFYCAVFFPPCSSSLIVRRRAVRNSTDTLRNFVAYALTSPPYIWESRNWDNVLYRASDKSTRPPGLTRFNISLFRSLPIVFRNQMFASSVTLLVPSIFLLLIICWRLRYVGLCKPLVLRIVYSTWAWLQNCHTHSRRNKLYTTHPAVNDYLYSDHVHHR